ncbi:hypothetical protein BDW72DRAFT_197859 [Aspergillus terricola var. indicus]
MSIVITWPYKGRLSLGLDGWCQAASFTGVRDEWAWGTITPTVRSIGHLGTVCLEQPEIPPSKLCPLKPNSDEQMDEVYLVISTWLRKRGDLTNAREVLRGRVKHCIALLSDNDISNDKDAYMTLFKTFITDLESHEDCEAVLQANAGAVGRSSESSEDSQLADNKVDVDEDDERLNVRILDALYECLSCRKQLQNIHFWYFCRSCPYSTLCRRCYRELKGRPHPSVLFGTCTSEHEFFYTGGLLRPSQLVDDGMVPLVSSDGARRAIWVEEWKDILAGKWQTKDFEYEKGFSAWCMRVLPEPQRTRWAAFFQI